MFCDLVGSTALSLRLDPEELRDVVHAYQQAAAGAIERYGGWIAQYLGDGILAYFGYPAALEHEAEAAVRSAADVVQAVRAVGVRPDVELAVRIGIHTGLVVVGEVGGGGRRDHLALGEVPNLAARLQGIAEPNTIVLSAESHGLVADRFECVELGTPALKGVARAGLVYRLVGERVRRIASPASKMVGRERELATLLALWASARESDGRVAVISGDPGLGKSYLVREFRSRAGASSCAQLECRCLPYFQNTAYHPITELLRAEAGCEPDQPVHERLRSLALLLERNGAPVEQTLPLFASLLSVPADDLGPALELAPEAQKARTREALLRLFVSMCSHEPLILVVEDLHWADPSTLELLALLSKELSAARMLLLLTHRPGVELIWAAEVGATSILLGNLTRDQAVGIIDAVTDGRVLPAELMRQIAERTDGVPLFIEELTRTILESGMLREQGDHWVLDGPLPPLAIPRTLHDSLEARLDRLSSVKEIAQLGATLGREFSYSLLRAVAPVAEPILQAALDQLVAADLLRVAGESHRRTYTFKHALIQEAAYESLLRSSRQQHHVRVARALEGEFAASVAATPEILAHHYTAAGLNDQGVRQWKLAGRRALARSANAEAAAHLRAGLDLIPRLSDRRAAAREELELLAMLGPAVIALRGYSAPELEDIFGRARILCAGIDDPALFGPVLTGIFAFHFVRADQAQSEALAAELDAAARQTGDGMLALTAGTVTGLVCMVRGDFAAAAVALEKVIADYDRDRDGAHAFVYGQDIGVIALIYLGLATHMLGRPAAARRMTEEAVRLADEVRHPHSLAAALTIGGTLLYLQRDVEGTRVWSDRLAALSVEQGSTHWSVEAGILQGWVLAMDGRADEAIATIDRARDLAASIGIGVRDRYYQVLAATLGLVGRPAEGIAMLDPLRDRARRRGERWWWRAAIDRIQGGLTLAMDPEADAEPWFRSSLELAREFDSPTLALEAAMALDELWSGRGQPDRGRALVQEALAAMPERVEVAAV
jgi:class 3 adenylate cyclase/predicted ATPase